MIRRLIALVAVAGGCAAAAQSVPFGPLYFQSNGTPIKTVAATATINFTGTGTPCTASGGTITCAFPSATSGLAPVSETSGYTFASGDFGASPTKLFVMNCSSLCVDTAPATAPTANAELQGVNASPFPLLVDANGLTINGHGWPLVVGPRQSFTLTSDGSNYFAVTSGGLPDQTGVTAVYAQANNQIYDYTNSIGSQHLTGGTGCTTKNVSGTYPENPVYMQLQAPASSGDNCWAVIGPEADAGAYGDAANPTLMIWEGYVGPCSGTYNPPNTGTNWCNGSATTANVRMFWGFFGGLGENATSQAGTDTLYYYPSGSGNAAFRYSTSAGDTHIMAVTTDSAGGVTTCDTGAAPDTALHHWMIVADDLDSEVFFLRDGALLCGAPVTTHLPFWTGTGTPNAPYAGALVTSLSSSNTTEIHVGPMSFSRVW